ncbi:MAG: MarR family transcriptional regulator [Bacteroidia bacterium]|nr:MarR family transcriptional regulator [Bacteroidia bacterium]
MLLSKEIAVSLNLSACKLKQYTAAALREYNIALTPEQFLLVDLLWNQGPMTQQAMADMMQKDKNSVTKLVDALEVKGMIVRRRNETDRRSNLLVLTRKAENMKNVAKEKGISVLDRMLEGISEEELRSFLVTLNKLNANMSEQITVRHAEV